MFGFKIIKKKEYDNVLKSMSVLKELHDKAEEKNKLLEGQLEEINNSLKSFEQEIDEESERKKAAYVGLTDLFILRAQTYPCDKCTLESRYCKKLIFADRTICVADKEHVNSFRNKKKAAS